MSKDNGMYKLPKNFFDENPIKEVSAAYLTYFQIQTYDFPGFNDEIEQLVVSKMDKDRCEKYVDEKQHILEIDNADDAIMYMRKIKELQNRAILTEKVLSMQDEVMPLILKRLLTSGHDVFIESAVCALAYADMKYVEMLYDMFKDIRSPYARSEESIVFGVQKRRDYTPLLLEQYKKIRLECPEKDYEQGPLLALYLIHET